MFIEFGWVKAHHIAAISKMQVIDCVMQRCSKSVDSNKMYLSDEAG